MSPSPVPPDSASGWLRQAAGRARTLLPLKAIGTMGFMLLFFWGYFTVLRHPRIPPLVMPLTPLDRWIPFYPAAFPVYASLWVYVSLPPAFFAGLRPLLLYGGWIAGMCLFCLGIFWLMPTMVPPFTIDWAAYPELGLLKSVDASGNACPSLHVATAVFSAFWLDRLIQRIGAPLALRVANGALCLAILWSTMATRQHVSLDVLTGAVIGAGFAVLSYRHVCRPVDNANF